MYVLKAVNTGSDRSLVISQIFTGSKFGQLLSTSQTNQAGLSEDCVLVNTHTAQVFCFGQRGLEYSNSLETHTITHVSITYLIEL